MYPKQLLLILWILSLGLIGCSNPQRNVSEHYEKITEGYTKQAEQTGEIALISWDDAVRSILQNNLELRESSNGIIEARESTKRVFLDLVPPVNISANVSRQLTDIGNINRNDLNFGVFSTLSVPGIVRFKINHYVAVLQEIRAGWAWELKRREQLADLRTLFIRSKNLERLKRTLELTGIREKNQKNFSTSNQRPAELERRQRVWQIKQQEDRLALDTNKLLGDYSKIWKLDIDTLPKLYDGKAMPNIKDTERVGVIWRQLRAIELEGARVVEKGAILNYWPDINVSITSQPLYQVQGGRSRSWRGDDLLLNLNSNYQVDTQLRNAFRTQQIRRTNALIVSRIQEDSAELVRNLQDGTQAYKLNRDETTIVEARYQLILRNFHKTNLAAMNDTLESLLQLEDQLAQLESEKVQLESLFWLLDESKWKRMDFETLLIQAKKQEKRHSFR